ncbi:transcriptional regulator family: Helix-loop-helix [Paecilomyces variotii]|nr:transcriptional regulator family: Helix-loop-helix [Paecilomyces variotii]KAJ9373899.1 transcriptional regulator family: Helix-loop-helix [Paecilomyces variotii]
MRNHDQRLALNTYPVEMATGVENSTSAENVKTAIIADPYSLEWWNSAWHAPWGYQRDRFIFDAMHDMNRDPSSSDLKRESYHDPPTMSSNSKYADHISEPTSPSLISSSNSLSPVPTSVSEYSSTHAGSPASIQQSIEKRPGKASLHHLSPQFETNLKQISGYNCPLPLTHQTLMSDTSIPSMPSLEVASGQCLTKEAQESAKARRKIAHNAVERRYRVKMNAKFIALGKAIPSLRAGKPNASLRSKGIKVILNDSTVIQNKAEVLTKAVAYIQELEEQRSLLHREICSLRDHLLPRGIW